MHIAMVCVDLPGAPGLPGFLGTLFAPDLSPDDKIDLLASAYNVRSQDDRESLAERTEAMGAFSEVLERRSEERGVAKGMAKGMAKGRLEGLCLSARRLMDSLGYTLDQALDFLGVTGEERKGCEELVRQAEKG